MAGPSEYDKLKEMYRLQGQDEQAKRFRATTGMPEAQGSPAAPGPMEGLEPSPIMEASIAKDRAQVESALGREDAAFRAAYEAERGPGTYNEDRFSGGVIPGHSQSFAARYGADPDIFERLESRGLVSLSPALKSELSRVQALRATAGSAQDESRRLEYAKAAPVATPKPGGGYDDAGYRVGLRADRGSDKAVGPMTRPDGQVYTSTGQIRQPK